MMTTKDACSNAWLAVLRGNFLGMAVMVGVALQLMGCATLDQNLFAEQTYRQSDALGAEEDASPKVAQATAPVANGTSYQARPAPSGRVEKGTASWYGKRFHGRRTSSGERFDMHAMTAAHKHLPIASLIQVTNLDNGLSTVVRVNDRGPYRCNRVLDLSYAAASELDMIQKGSARVRIQVIDSAKPDLEKGLQDMFVAASDKARTGSQVDHSTPRAVDPAFMAPGPTAILANLFKSPDTKPAKVVIASAKTLDLYLQVGAFGNRSTAENLRQELVTKLEAGVRVNTDVSDDAAPYQVQVGPLDSRTEANDLSRKLASLGLDSPRIVSR